MALIGVDKGLSLHKADNVQVSEVISVAQPTSYGYDGWVLYSNAAWATCRAAATGGGYYSNETYIQVKASIDGTYEINRGFIWFDLSGLSGDSIVLGAKLNLKFPTEELGAITIQQGTQGYGLSSADFDAFTGDPFVSQTVVWNAGGTDFDLGSAGITYVVSVLGSGAAKFCIREKEHDYDNLAPDGNYRARIDSAQNATPADRPALIITQANNLVAIDDGYSQTKPENISVTETIVLQADDSNHAHTADNIALTQLHYLTLQDADHAHTADNVKIDSDVFPDDCDHAHTTDNVTMATNLITQSADHAHTVDNVTVSTPLFLQDADHTHTADNVSVINNPTYGAVTAEYATCEGRLNSGWAGAVTAEYALCEGYTGASGAVECEEPTCAGTMVNENLLTGAVVAEYATCEGYTGASGAVECEEPTCAGTVVGENLLSGAVYASTPTLAGTLVSENLLSGAVTTEYPTCAGTIDTERLLAGAVTSEHATCAGTMLTGNILSAALTAEYPTCAGTSYGTPDIAGAVIAEYAKLQGSMHSSSRFPTYLMFERY